MSRWETRTKQMDRNSFGRLGAVLRRAGRMAGERLGDPGHRALFENLENRILLYGDHPGFTDVFNRPDPLLVPEIVLDIDGVGNRTGTINPGGDNDVFRFVAPANDFVRIWADTINTNDPSMLDSRVEIYRREGPNHRPIPIVSGSHNNGGDGTILTGGNFGDGWAGFVAQADTEYFIVVRSDEASGPTATGDYIIRVAALSINGQIDESTGQFVHSSQINLVGGDVVYRIRSGEADHFNGLITAAAVANHDNFDPRIEIYGAHGHWISGDSDTGRLSDSFTVFRGQQRADDGSDVFYVRVRGDQFDPTDPLATGSYQMRLNSAPQQIEVDPVTRRAYTGVESIANDSFHRPFRFEAKGSGIAIITVNVGFMGGLADSAIRLYEVAPRAEGDGDIDRRITRFEFNELPGAFSRLIIPLTGGVEYFLVVESFDGGVLPGMADAFILELETHHTLFASNWTPGANSEPLDDHASTPPGEFDPEDPEVRRRFEMATPIVWGDPQLPPQPRTPVADSATLGTGGEYFEFEGPFILPVPVEPHPNAAGPYDTSLETDRPMVQIGRATGRIMGGADTDLFQFVPPVDMLGEYEGMILEDEAVMWDLTTGGPIINPATQEPWFVHPAAGAEPELQLWHPHFRPSTRLQITTVGLTMVNSRIRVFDSNFDLVYDTNNNVLAGFPQPSGMLDPASWPPELHPFYFGYTFAQEQPAGIEVWGGEVYYLEVSAQNGMGRYEVELQVDAPVDHPTTAADISHFGPAIPSAGQWESAYELWVSPNGAASNRVGAADGSAQMIDPFAWIYLVSPSSQPLLHGRGWAMNFDFPEDDEFGPGGGAFVSMPIGTPGSRGKLIMQMSDLATITSPTDTHLYQFRALQSGTAEIRINTTNLQDSFFELIADSTDGDPMTPPQEMETRKSKTYQSPLHSALRIFDNDLNEVGFNAGNGVTGGESATMVVGGHDGERTFQQRDARVVIHVEKGKNYFIQVESGQRAAFLEGDQVDWRHAIGSYELLVNSMPDLSLTGDDHINRNLVLNNTSPLATPIPLNMHTTSTTEILGRVTGEIRHTTQNPNDSDLFMFTAPGAGVATISSVTRAGEGFPRQLRVFDETGAEVAFNTGDTSVLTTQLAMSRGDRFWVAVDGIGQGNYEIRVSGIPFVDDHASMPFWSNATHIDKSEYNFTGFVEIDGALEARGDSDIFSFDAIAFDMVTATVTGLSGPMRPQIRVYEIGVDPVGNPVPMMIAHRAQLTENSTTFSVTAPDRTNLPTGNTYNKYYVVVSGLDPDVHFGNYRLRLDFNVTTDDHPDEGQWDLASELIPGQQGAWTQNGIIEIVGDTDLFTFVAEAGGTATITITSPEDSLLLPQVRIFRDDGGDIVPVRDQSTQEFEIAGLDAAVSTATFRFTASRDTRYWIVVEAGDVTGNTHKTELVGHYDVHLAALIDDDHANEGEWELATQIVISRFTGRGLETGIIEIPNDTDLFYFEALVDGDHAILINVPVQAFRPYLRLFDENHQPIGFPVRDGDMGDETGVGPQNGRVQVTIEDAVEGSIYYILVSSDQTNPPELRTGAYQVQVNGPTPPRGDDDHANAGDWEEATLIELDVLSGRGREIGNIDYLGDSDLFVFVSLAGDLERPRPAQVFITSPAGAALNLRVTIFDPNRQMIVSSSTGGPGVNAGVDFNITTTAQRYWVLVEHLDESLDNRHTDYTVQIETTPPVFHLYSPEGYAHAGIHQYITVVNPNDYDVTYTVRLRYENDLPETVIANNFVVPANSRRGVTVSDGPRGVAEGVIPGQPYAIVIEADGFLGANLSHYDFGSTLGESFSRITSDTWSFAEGRHWPGAVRDYLLYYNPNPTPVQVTLTAHLANGDVVEQSHIVEGNRRGGWSFNNMPELGLGRFGFVVTSQPVNPNDTHVGIVASLSHYDLDHQTGYATLGDPYGGSMGGAIAGIANGPTDFTNVTFYNAGDTPAVVELRGRYTNSNLPNLREDIIIPARSSLTFDGGQLGMVNNQTMGLRWDSNVPLTVLATTARSGDMDASMSGTHAANRWYFADAFLNRNEAGRLYFESLFLYNPNPEAITVTLNFYNNHGEMNTTTVSLPGRDFGKVRLHDLEAAMPRVFNFFGIEATADLPFLVNMTHYDLVLAGGWGTAGAPLGITTPIWRI